MGPAPIAYKTQSLQTVNHLWCVLEEGKERQEGRMDDECATDAKIPATIGAAAAAHSTTGT